MSCRDRITEQQYAEIRCVSCEEAGTIGTDGKACDECGGTGFMRLTQCPREFIGSDLADAINIAAMSQKGFLPVAGGILDQSRWFVDLMSTLESDQNQIDAERMEEMRARRGW